MRSVTLPNSATSIKPIQIFIEQLDSLQISNDGLSLAVGVGGSATFATITCSGLDDANNMVRQINNAINSTSNSTIIKNLSPVFSSVTPNAWQNFDGSYTPVVAGNYFAGFLIKRLKFSNGLDSPDGETLTSNATVDSSVQITGAAISFSNEGTYSISYSPDASGENWIDTGLTIVVTSRFLSIAPTAWNIVDADFAATVTGVWLDSFSGDIFELINTDGSSDRVWCNYTIVDPTTITIDSIADTENPSSIIPFPSTGTYRIRYSTTGEIWSDAGLLQIAVS